MALTYMELGKYNQAIEVFHECLALAKEISPADVGHNWVVLEICIDSWVIQNKPSSIMNKQNRLHKPLETKK